MAPLQRPMPDAGANAVSDLLNDIRKGATLRKVETSTTAVDKNMGMFAGIDSASHSALLLNIYLGNSVEAILARRAAIVGSDSSDSDDEFDDGWEDDYSL